MKQREYKILEKLISTKDPFHYMGPIVVSWLSNTWLTMGDGDWSKMRHEDMSEIAVVWLLIEVHVENINLH